MMKLHEETYNKLYASAITLGIMVLLLLITLFIIFKTPLPPYEESGGSGVGVNFGTTENGLGDNTTEMLTPIETSNQQSQANTSSSTPSKGNEAQIVTSEVGESASINSSKTPAKTFVVNPSSNEQKLPEITAPVVNPLASYKKKAPSDGNTKGTGNMGDPNGSPNVKTYTGKPGDGTGGPGGNGTGDRGVGPGSGPGVGTMVSLGGRAYKSISKPVYNSQATGTVKVKIWVDKAGNVTRAQAGAPGTTTTDLGLWRLSEQAALKSKFVDDDDAAVEQQGVITYIYINN